MVVRYTETKDRGIEINIEDFVNDCLAYKLPELLPDRSEEDIKAIGTILHDKLMKTESSNEDEAWRALQTLGITLRQFGQLKRCAENILGAIMGLGIDMLEPNAPELVMWTV